MTTAALDNLVKLNDAAGKPAKTVVIVHEDGLFGSGMAKLMNAEMPKRGFEIMETIAHPTPSRDMSNVALRIKSLNPDLVVPSSYYGEFVLLARTLQQQKIHPKGIYAVLNGAASNFRFVKEFPEAANLVMDCNHWADPRKPKRRRFALPRRRDRALLAVQYPAQLFVRPLLADAIERAAPPIGQGRSEALANSTFSDHIMPYGPTQVRQRSEHRCGARQHAGAEQRYKGDLPGRVRRRQAGVPVPL